MTKQRVHLAPWQHGFVFYPTGDGGHVGYYLDTAHLDYAAEYHRRPVSLHVEVADPFIYARFAYAVVNLPRCDDLFEGVPVGDAVKIARERRVLKEALAAGEPTPEWIELMHEGYDPNLRQLYEGFMAKLGPGVFAMYDGSGEDGGAGKAAVRAA